MAFPVRSYSHESAGSASAAGAAAAGAPVDDPHLGAWRSRTLLFLSYRSSAPRRTSNAFASSSRSSFESPLLGADLEAQGAPQRPRRPGTYYDASGALASYPPAAAEALPPRWVDTSDAVEALLHGIGPKMERLERMHAKHLLPGFVDRRAEERAIETLTQEITKVRLTSRFGAILLLTWASQDLRKATSQIRQLANATAANAAASEAALARNVQTALATRVQTLSAAFRKRQADYMRRMRGIEARGKEWTAGSGSGKGAEEREALREDVELVSAAAGVQRCASCRQLCEAYV
jgi:syntaxin 16